MKSYSKVARVATVLILSIGCDQVLKELARAFLRFSPPTSYLNDFIRMEYAENRGVMLSIGAALSQELRFWIFTVVVGLLLVGMLAYILWNREFDPTQTIAWSLLVSGGLGNLVDRVLRHGVVVDYVSVGIGMIRTAVFNLADVLVFVGVFILLIHKTRKNQPSELDKAPASKE
jgi:signal peptidase II